MKLTLSYPVRSQAKHPSQRRPSMEREEKVSMSRGPPGDQGGPQLSLTFAYHCIEGLVVITIFCTETDPVSGRIDIACQFVEFSGN